MLSLILSFKNKSETFTESNNFEFIQTLIERIKVRDTDEFGYIEIPVVDVGVEGVCGFKPEEVVHYKVIEMVTEQEQQVASAASLLESMRPGKYNQEKQGGRE